TPEDLSACKLGYRANYLIKTAAMVKEEGKVCQERLKDYCGVGPKVANCISLFSMGRIESFPIDTWVEKVMRERYGIEDKKEMAKFAKTTFGPYGGIAQQYLFYYLRNKMSGA
ncbi:MAG: 8-oxoguanine DNA glycosylase, partial [Anaerovoracaceae bacterium]